MSTRAIASPHVGVAVATRQTAALARRAVVNTLRLPQAWIPAILFPLILMTIFTASFGQAPGRLPGFPPVRGFLDFAVAGAILQGVLIGGTGAGAFFAADIEGGFFDRLVASPVSRAAILTGRLAGGVVLATVQALLFLGMAIAFGAEVQGGVVGVLIVTVLAALLAVAVGGLGVMLALRTGSAEAVQGTFPLFFALMFFSSAFFPRETMNGWFKTVADINPISHLVEGMREQIVVGVDWHAAGIACAIVLAMAAVTVGLSAVGLSRRLGGRG